jgi:CheY-like chemotaxis protein
VLDTLRDVLEVLGYEASTAASGELAIAVMATVQPHVVLLDLKMPGMSGVEVLEHLRQHHRAVPVIVITGSMNEEIARQASAGGALVAVVGKPFDMEALRGWLTRAMQLARRS